MNPTISSITPDWIIRLLRNGDDDLPVVQAAQQEFNIRRARASGHLDFDTITHPDKYDAYPDGTKHGEELMEARRVVEDLQDEIAGLQRDLRDAQHEVYRLEKGRKP